MGTTRERILEAAEKLLLLKGSAHVTTKEIARAVGLSESALYRHFDHKEDIFFALMAEHQPAFQEAFKRIKRAQQRSERIWSRLCWRLSIIMIN